jgi:hypothetical protein
MGVTSQSGFSGLAEAYHMRSDMLQLARDALRIRSAAEPQSKNVFYNPPRHECD